MNFSGDRNTDNKSVIYIFFINGTDKVTSFVQTAEVTTFYIFMILCSVGLIGNTLSLIVWIKGQKCSQLKCSTYFKLLAASDMFALSYRFITVFVFPPVSETITTSFSILCALRAFLFYFAPQLSAWIIVCLSVERMLTVCFPFKFSANGLKRKAKIAFSFCILTLSIVNCPGFWFVSKNGKCSLSDPSVQFVKLIEIMQEISSIYILCALPFLFITVSNVLTSIQIARIRKLGRTNDRRSRILSTFTRLSLFTGILQCISIIPLILVELHYAGRISFFHSEHNYTIWQCSYIISLYLNNSLNFILYFITGKDFRDDLRRLLSCFSNREH